MIKELFDIDIADRLPHPSEFKPERPSQLEGTEKQVKWAAEIRNSILRQLSVYAVTRTSDGRPSDLYNIAKQGKDAIMKDIAENPLINEAEGKIREEKLQRAIDGYQDLADRIKRYNSIANNTSAKFWIDNRTDQLENFNNKKP